MGERGTSDVPCPKCGCVSVTRDFDESPTWLRVTFDCGAEVVACSEHTSGEIRWVSKCRKGIWIGRLKRFGWELVPSWDEMGAFGVRLVAAVVFYNWSFYLPDHLWPLPEWINPQKIIFVGSHFMLFLGFMSLVGRAEKIINSKIRTAITRTYQFVVGDSPILR